ncbi:MAG: hypothetical protein WDM96_09530 [Lacunisphaera sp.]
MVNRADPAGGITHRVVTLYSGATGSTASQVNFNLTAGTGSITTIAIPGGLALGSLLTPTSGRRFTVTTADGVTSAAVTATSATQISSVSADNPVVAVNFINTAATAASTRLTFTGSTVPVSLALAPSIAVTSTTNAANTLANSGDLTLANTWDLAGLRFGSRAEAGFLTLRARGNLAFTFDASLTDGFDAARASDTRYAQLLAPLLAPGMRSWSYQLVAGADYASASPTKVRPLDALAANSGSVLIGRGGIALPTTGTATISSLVPFYYQTIRTGTGDISLAAGRDVQLLNPLATVYTAGTATAALNGFEVPVLTSRAGDSTTTALYYIAQYPTAGGDISVAAQGDIVRYQQTFNSVIGALVTSTAASGREMPTNWLYRRGLVGKDGNFSTVTGASLIGFREIQSTSWWVDYSNFFDDFGALGGGNLTLSAGRDVANVNAAVPSNARLPGFVTSASGVRTPIAPDANALVELGGGDLAVSAGRNVDGGVYYVERGRLDLAAGAAITTNNTRYALGVTAPAAPDETTLLPTTLFLGKGQAAVEAGGDILLGAVANPFWFPQGAKNRNYDVNFFSTFEETTAVRVASVGGDVTLSASPATETSNAASLAAWYGNFMSAGSAANYLPWLALVRSTSSAPTVGGSLRGVAAVLPGTVDVTANSGDIDLIGRLVLAPARRGNLNLVAAGNLNGLAVNGLNGWSTSAVILSDASPAALPGPSNPLSFATYQTNLFPNSGVPMLQPIDALFDESGSTGLSLARKTTLHASIDGAPLHAGDLVPALLYAAGGDLSGLTLYSAKSTRAAAGHDVTDVALYIQNVQADDVSLVAAGRDVAPYDPNSSLRKEAAGALVLSGNGVTGVASPDPNAGDIQVSGPGQLEVIAGRDVNLGTGAIAATDRPAAGITSVGLARNPGLPQGAGASITVAVGVGSIYVPNAPAGQGLGLASTKLDFPKFISAFLDPATAGDLALRYLPVLGAELGLTGQDPAAIWAKFGYAAGQLLAEQKAAALVAVFYRVLRDAARDRNNPDSATFGKYTNGFAAIEALFPAVHNPPMMISSRPCRSSGPPGRGRAASRCRRTWSKPLREAPSPCLRPAAT